MPMALRRCILLSGALSLALIVGAALTVQAAHAQESGTPQTIEEAVADEQSPVVNNDQTGTTAETTSETAIQGQSESGTDELEGDITEQPAAIDEPNIDEPNIDEPGIDEPTSIDRAYLNYPRGPGVDTPTMPAAPSMTSTPPDPLLPPPVTHLELVLDWHPGPRHAALLVADALGLFTRRGLDVKMRPPADPDIPAKLVAASRVDLALTDQATLHQLVDEGKPLIRVATLIELPLAAVVASQDSGIRSALSLIDQRVGYSTQASHDVILRAILSEERLNLSHVEARDVHFSTITAMSEGRVDALVAGSRFSLPRQLADLGVATRILPLEELGFPIHDGLIMVANVDHLAARKSSIRRFVSALQEATEWITAHPDMAWEIMVEQEPTIDSTANAEAWPNIRRRLALRPGAVDMARYRRLEHYLWEHDIIETLTPPEKLAKDPG
ncbi:ABC transporter substrate-binding protein [Halomonas huangheensis]|uniref:SsuA/THI5-like domain-containing protein n=1 Tax=Halomonas huangheensis TaxID=1178482 RepID=W1NCQ4_9GAMM|nr:ABC transporter substrate-binding protein [Halomonas huangheensis]ALM52517.1 hypothetical protein AR456_09685 [Halomonas huangheensis]ERL52981.1 hypothetical protein BJB45_17020 [Halomonas huangheensis]